VALTTAVGEMQKFFGISELLLPCAVVVSLQEKAAFVVAVTKNSSVYQLLKLIKTKIEPVTAQISQKEVELARAKDDRRICRTKHDWGLLRRKAAAVRREWTEYKTRVANELVNIAGERTAEEAALCRWMSTRLDRDESLTADEWASARALLSLLGTARTSGRLLRKLRRTLTKLNDGYPERHEALTRLAAATAWEDATQMKIAQVKAELDILGRELCLSAAVVAAAEELGLMPEESRGLLPWRQLTWPVTVLAQPERTAPKLRFGRA